jgi:hypothetical protein
MILSISFDETIENELNFFVLCYMLVFFVAAILSNSVFP